MTWVQAVVAIVVAIIGTGGATFGFLQFMIKRKDEKEERDIQTLINKSLEEAKQKFIFECGQIGDKAIEDAISTATTRVREEFQEGLKMRGDESTERFMQHTEEISTNNKMIKELLEMQMKTDEKFDRLAESLTALNEATVSNSKVVQACAEGVKSTLYDKIYIVAEKAIKRKGITVDEKANIKQLYQSYSELNGNSKGSEYARICLEQLETLTDEEAARRDMEINSKSA